MAKSERIKVAQIIARMNVGGPAVIVADLMSGLDSSKFEQLLITGYCDSDEADYLDEVATDIEATRIAGLGRSVSPVADFKAFIELISMLRKFKPDVIHTHTAKAGVLGRLAALIAGGRAIRVHTFHGHLLHGYFSPFKTKLVVAIEKLLAAKTHFLIAVGTQVKNDLIRAGIGSEPKFRVFFPGLPAPHLSNKSELRSSLELDPHLIYVTFVGRLTQIKRPDRLMDIAAEISKAHKNVHFLVAGEGDLLEYTQQRAATQKLPVTFLGWRKDIDELFAASDIAILTSDNEGIPLTLIQAAQAGLPIVAPAVGSISDIVITHETGLLASPHPVPMAAALTTLIQDSELRARYGGAGKERAEKYFSLTRELDDHAKLYDLSQEN